MSLAEVNVADFMFCKLCGTLLSMESTLYASCSLCGTKRDINDFCEKEIWTTIGAEDLRKHLNLEPFLSPEEKYVGQQRATVNEECPQCKNPQLEFYTRQLRSADEGQTVFYECPKCRYKFAQNS